MQLKSLALAVAALSSAGLAQAYTDSATNLYLTGASAIRNNVAAAIKAQCTADGGTLTVYKNGASTSSLANQMAYVCSAAMAGTPITTVLHTVTGGSLNSILGMSDDAAKQQTPVSLTSGCTAAVAGSGALAGYSVRANCALETAAAPSDGGFSDVEYAPVREQVDVLKSDVDGFSVDEVTQGFTGVAQVFGLAVSEKLYKDLQAAQGLTAAGCTAGDPLPACQPSLSRADVVSLINNNEFTAHKSGAEALGLTAGASIEYARRVTTSGTQSSAQVLFLGKGCLTGSNGGELQVIGDEIAAGATQSYNGGLFTVSANSGTGDVINRLNAAGNSAYAFGWVSGENRAPSTTTGWKFIKLNGAYFSDGTSTGLNKQNAIDGGYDYFVEAVSYKGPAAKTDDAEGTLLDAISGKMATVTADGGPATVGLFIIPENTAGYSHADHPTEVSVYQRGGSGPNSCQPVSRPF
ncbi:MAG: hypothetical protein KDI08_07330 [Pseudomonadales bacterium]|nr:hypothetical protein [Pseudomonadales bacterium]MCP5332380.1 hypothetical protein [Pseudomonadales bacterium]